MRVSKQVFIRKGDPISRLGRKQGRSRSRSGRSLSLFIIVCAVMFYPKFACAAASISLSGGTWALGTKGALSESQSASNAWTITNDSGGTEDVLIKVTSPLPWTASSDATLTTNEFLLRKDNSTGQILTATDWTMVTSLANAGTSAFGLYFKTPPTGSEEGAHTLTVTLTATNYVAPFVCGTSTVTDVDGNTYSTTLIGTQCWMTANMRTTKYPDATAITRGPTGATWDGTDHGYYACPPNTANTAEDCAAISTLGYVYQWSAAMKGSASCNGTGAGQPACSTPVQGICPAGWHIPSHYEFTLLERSLLSSTAFPYDITTTGWLGTTEGTMLKSSGSPYFNALLAGYRGTTGAFSSRGSFAVFWSSLESDADAWGRYLYSPDATVGRYSSNKAYGFSVRCLKD